MCAEIDFWGSGFFFLVCFVLFPYGQVYATATGEKPVVFYS